MAALGMVLAWGGAARAEEPAAAPVAAPVRFEVGGYGELQFAFLDHGEDRTRPGGAAPDARLVFDTTRLVMGVEAQLPYGLEAEAEVEFEHGGAGAAMELEYEEFGEFEQEVGKGGEVLVEELYLARRLGERLELKVGRMYVAVGTLARYYRPTDYLGAGRSEAETLLLPSAWDEMGAALEAHLGAFELTAQVVNGLDSTGFGSAGWVAGGHQRRFELVRASDLAFVARADFGGVEGLVAGVSAYVGGTTRNRPKQDLQTACDPAAGQPCAPVPATLALGDVHLRLARGPWRASALVLFGQLQNAAAVSARNARLSNLLGVPRTPVSDRALAAWAELGYDLAPRLDLPADVHLAPFARVEFADAMFRPRAELFDNPRFQRTVLAAGVSAQLGPAFAKLDALHRRFATSALRPETEARLALGFSL